MIRIIREKSEVYQRVKMASLCEEAEKFGLLAKSLS